MDRWDTWKFFLLFAALLVVIFVPLAKFAGASLIEMGIIVGVLLLGILGIQIADFFSSVKEKEISVIKASTQWEMERQWLHYHIAAYNAWVAHKEYLKLKARRWELIQVYCQARNAFLDYASLEEKRMDFQRELWCNHWVQFLEDHEY